MNDARWYERFGRHVGAALVAGPLIGLAVGALVTTFTFGWGRSNAAIATLIGCAIASTLIALLLAGYSSLESPDPGAEPSDTERPVADRTAPVREEHPEPSAGGSERSRGR